MDECADEEVDEEVQEGEEQNLNRGGRVEASKKHIWEWMIGAPLPYNHHSLPSFNQKALE